jgi:hypothetical protein
MKEGKKEARKKGRKEENVPWPVVDAVDIVIVQHVVHVVAENGPPLRKEGSNQGEI